MAQTVVVGDQSREAHPPNEKIHNRSEELFKGEIMRRKKTKINRVVEKYYRWLRRSWYFAYLKPVRQIEEEIGGELHAC